MNEILSEIMTTSLDTLASIVVLFLLSKLDGPRQISQLSFYDYIVGITIGSLASEMAINDDIPFYVPLIAIVLYALFSYLVSKLTSKSFKARKLFTGSPIILMHQGKLMQDGMNKVRFDINDLLSQCRNSGYFNLSDLQEIVMEPNGKLSFLAKSEKRPVQCKDLQLHPKEEKLMANVVIDGQMRKEPLEALGLNDTWLNNELKRRKLNDLDEIMLVMSDGNDNFEVFIKAKHPKHCNYFI